MFLLDSQRFDGEAKILMSFQCFESFNNEALLYFSRSGWGYSFLFNHTHDM